MLTTHFTMDKQLKETFKKIDELLSQRHKMMKSRRFFTDNATTQDNFQACRHEMATYYACAKAMNAINDLSWLYHDGNLNKAELNIIQSIATSIQDYLNGEMDKNDSAREIILHIDNLKLSLNNDSTYTTFNAILNMAWDSIGLAASVMGYGVGIALLAGVASAGMTIAPTIALGISLAIMGTVVGILALGSFETYGRYALGSQVKELDQFTEALSKQHHIELNPPAKAESTREYVPTALQ